MTDRLDELTRPVVEALGCELWGIEYLPLGRHSTLRIYIDSPDGVAVEDCARVSRQMSSLLDVEDPIRGEYTLEVSSPGLDRRLFSIGQCAAFVGANVSIRLKQPCEGRRRFSGLLRGIEGDQVIIGQGDEEILFPFEEIERANVVPDIQERRVTG